MLADSFLFIYFLLLSFMCLLILQLWQKSDLLIGIELNILESMHIYFMMLSTCQI